MYWEKKGGKAGSACISRVKQGPPAGEAVYMLSADPRDPQALPIYGTDVHRLLFWSQMVHATHRSRLPADDVPSSSSSFFHCLRLYSHTMHLISLSYACQCTIHITWTLLFYFLGSVVLCSIIHSARFGVLSFGRRSRHLHYHLLHRTRRWLTQVPLPVH